VHVPTWGKKPKQIRRPRGGDAKGKRPQTLQHSRKNETTARMGVNRKRGFVGERDLSPGKLSLLLGLLELDRTGINLPPPHPAHLDGWFADKKWEEESARRELPPSGQGIEKP